MAWVVAFFGVTVMVIGVWAIASPRGAITFLSRWLAWTGVGGGALLRLLLAMAFWFAAGTSRMPVVLRVVAVAFLIAGLALPLVGSSLLHEWMARVTARPDGLTREWAVVAVLVGGFLVWAVFPNVTANQFLNWGALTCEETCPRSVRHGLPASDAMNRHDRPLSHQGRAYSWLS